MRSAAVYRVRVAAAVQAGASSQSSSGLNRWHQLFLQHRCSLPPHRCLASLRPRPAALEAVLPLPPPTSLPLPSTSSAHSAVAPPPSTVHFDVRASDFPPRHLLHTLDTLPSVSLSTLQRTDSSLRYQTLPPLPLALPPPFPAPLHPASLHRPRVTVALSGGVDSSVSAFLLREAGYDVRCVYMRNWDERDETGQCSSEADRADAEAVCRHLSLPLECVEFVREYWVDVFERMVAGYSSGLTPNPDVWCNREIKFGRLLSWLADKEEKGGTQRRGGMMLATGHYARTQRVYGESRQEGASVGRSGQAPYVQTDLRRAVDDSLAYIESLQPAAATTGLSATFSQRLQHTSQSLTALVSARTSLAATPQLVTIPPSHNQQLLATRLLTALDPRKDQTYFLSLIPSTALPHLLFPLGCLTKPATRALARHACLPTASKADSMGICMIGRRPFNSWLAEYIAVREGRFIDEQGREVGRHKAAEVWTVGQGARLGGHKRRWYVAAKADEAMREVPGSRPGDVLVVNDRLHPRLLFDEVVVGEVNWLEGEPAEMASHGRVQLYCRLRSTELLRRCEVRRVGDSSGGSGSSGEQQQYVVRFMDMPHHLISPGQTCVFYLGEYCLGGGPIIRPGLSYHQQNKRLSFADC